MTTRVRFMEEFPYVRIERHSLLRDMLYGAAGGLVGTWLMGPVMQAAYKRIPQSIAQQMPESEGATEKLARKVLEPLGVQVEGERKKKLGNVVHWTYGITWGALYGALHRLPWVGKAFGLGFGLGLFLFGDELMVPALKLSPPPGKVPVPIHLGALAAHLVYGAAAEGSYRLARRALA